MSSKCEVCNKAEGTGVVASTLVAMSYSICQECLKAGAEPYFIVLGVVWSCGGIDYMSPFVMPTIHASLVVAGKTIEDLNADVEEEERKCNEYFNALKHKKDQSKGDK